MTIDGCAFDHLDGNALMLHGYTRGVVIARNEFVSLGAHAIVSWGVTDMADGTGPDHPRGTIVEFNIASEVGIWEKQASRSSILLFGLGPRRAPSRESPAHARTWPEKLLAPTYEACESKRVGVIWLLASVVPVCQCADTPTVWRPGGPGGPGGLWCAQPNP